MERRISVGVIGDFDPEFPPHPATNSALRDSAAVLGVTVDVRWHATDALVDADLAQVLVDDALWCAPGSPYRSLNGALRAIRFAREADVPLLGTCGDFQHVVLEYARNVLGFEDAQHAEYDPYASELFVTELSCSLAGREMAVEIDGNSRTAQFYARTEVTERYYCNFGLNPERQRLLHDGGLRVVGADRDGEARVVELADRRFFIATLFVPQLGSSPESPHPLITSYLRVAMEPAGAVRVAGHRLKYVDPNRPPSRFSRVYAALANTRLGRFMSVNLVWKVDPHLMRATRGRIGMGLAMPTALLETRGAKSGVVRRNVVIYFHDGDRITIIASKLGLETHPAWFHNLRVNPDVTFGGIPMRATVVGDEAERRRLWMLADRVFAPYAAYRREAAKANRTIPIVQLAVREPSAAA
jgi:deazaflavin-dependent oxidoreductase (nitroreductase family)